MIKHHLLTVTVHKVCEYGTDRTHSTASTNSVVNHSKFVFCHMLQRAFSN